MPDHTPSDILKGWAFVLRDLCDQGAQTVKVTLAGDITIRYSPKKGARFTIDGETLALTDAELDETGLVIVEDTDGVLEMERVA